MIVGFMIAGQIAHFPRQSILPFPLLSIAFVVFGMDKSLKLGVSPGGGQEINDVDQYYDTTYRTLFEFDSNKDKERVKEKLKYHKRFLRGGYNSLDWY